MRSVCCLWWGIQKLVFRTFRNMLLKEQIFGVSIMWWLTNYFHQLI